MEKAIWLVLMILCVSGVSFAETLHVDSRAGNDANAGTPLSPLRTLARALELVNGSTAPGPTTVSLAPGQYVLEKAGRIENKRLYTRQDRLTITADILPGAPGWTAASMPTIISVESPQLRDGAQTPPETAGLNVEIEHVTIKGLKFLGQAMPRVWYYPVYREGKSLDDLEISQCLFLNDRHVLTSNVGVLAHGHGLRVDHCVFFGCANAVVFWEADSGLSRGNAMTHCIVDGGYISGVWLCQTGEDLEFHHNIITNCQYAWMRGQDNRRTYKVHDCTINSFQHYSGQCSPSFELRPTGPEIVFDESNVTKTGDIKLENGVGIDMELPARYMHVPEGAPGPELCAGLFRCEP